MTALTTLQLSRIGKRYGALQALEAIDFEVEPGEILAVTGPSGAGKTTLCRLISGLERPSEGDIRLGGMAITSQPPQRRDVAYMFESYALYPHFTVFDNVASPLRAPRQGGRTPAAEIEARVTAVLRLAEMEALARRLPAELSGGQKQRVALCRNLVQEPRAYLFDEPISHLDAKLRHKLRGEIRRRQNSKAVPTLWFTPDAMEALSVGDRVAVLVDGRIQQIAAPDLLCTRPANTRVAKLIGDPAMNLLPGGVAEGPDGLAFEHADTRITLPQELASRLRRNGEGAACVLGVRPTGMAIVANGQGRAEVEAEVYACEPFGKYSIITLKLGDTLVKVKTGEAASYRAGARVGVNFPAAEFVVFDATSGEAISI